VPRREPSPEEARHLAERILEQFEMTGLDIDEDKMDIEKAIELVDINREELAELMYLGDMCGCDPEALIDLATSGRSGELVCENGVVTVAKHPGVTKVYGCGDEAELLLQEEDLEASRAYHG